MEYDPKQDNRTVRAGLAAGLAAVTLFTAGCKAGEFFTTGNPDAGGQPQESRLGNEVSDPQLRAEMLTVLNGETKIGSASLIRKSDGVISVVTAEHVARSASGLPPRVVEQQTGAHVAPGQPGQGETHINVPSVGLLNVAAEPDFTGAGEEANGSLIDRVAYYSLSAEDQAKLVAAEATADIKIPAASSYQPSFGDLLQVPVPDLGTTVPVVYVLSGDTAHQVVPLVMLDEGMDLGRGMQNLEQAKEQAAANEKAAAVVSARKALEDQGIHVPGTDDEILRDALQRANFRVITSSESSLLSQAIFDMQTAFVERHKPSDRSDLTDPIADKLLCHGDSGGVLTDPDGNIMGPYVSAEVLSDADYNTVRLLRPGQAAGSTATCLGISYFRTLG